LYHSSSMESSYQEVPSWIRRGHTRKPNVIVQLLYILFDKCGDFVPMFRSLFTFIGRFSLVVVNLVILVGTIVLSAAHSLELLRYAGFHYGLEWVAMVVWELVFIFSSIILSNDFKRGNWRSGWAPWAGFGLGFAFVEVSNILGMADNWIGLSIGISTPILLLVSKGLLAHQFKRTDDQKEMVSQTEPTAQVETNPVEKMEWKNSQPINQNEELISTTEMVEPTIQTTTENNQKTATEMDELSTKKMVEQATEKMDEPPTKKVVESTIEKVVETSTEKVVDSTASEMVDQLPEKQPEEQPQPTTNESTDHQPIRLDDDQPQPNTFEPVESMESASNQPDEETEESPVLESVETTKKMVEQATEKVDEINQENNQENDQSTNHVFDQPTNQFTNQIFDQKNNQISDPNTNQLTNQISTTQISGESNQPEDEETTIEPTKKTTKRKKQLTRSSSTEKMKKAAKKWAKDFYNQNGKLPGRLKLQNGAGCTDHVARQALAELKEELKEKLEIA
jgi:hypothetical protein